jgi:hypothetical protein
MIQKIKILLLLNFLLVNIAFSKEFPALFEVKIPVDQYTNTNDGLNKAFNRLIQKLSGSRSKKLLWRIGDAQLDKVVVCFLLFNRVHWRTRIFVS